MFAVEGFDVSDLVVTAVYDDPEEDRGIIKGLKPSTTYTVHVMAATSKGYGPAYYFDAKTTNDGRKHL